MTPDEIIASYEAVLGALKAALATSPDDESLAEKIAFYEAELVALNNPPAPTPLSLAEQVERDAIKAYRVGTTPAWSASKTYEEGNLVSHKGEVYAALPDVETGTAPDGIYDADAFTGGWKIAP